MSQVDIEDTPAFLPKNKSSFKGGIKESNTNDVDEIDYFDQKIKKYGERTYVLFQEILKKYESTDGFIQKKVLNNLLMDAIRIVMREQKICYGKNELRDWYQYAVALGMSQDQMFESLTVFNSNRSSSGVLVLTIALDGDKQLLYVPEIRNGKIILRDGDIQKETKMTCKYNCHYCPNETKENGAPKDMARSYLSNEPVFLIGDIEHFIVFYEILRRLALLEWQGHMIDKIELIFLGGTWDSFDKEYRDHAIHMGYYACNMFKHISYRSHGIYFNKIQEWRKKYNEISIAEYVTYNDFTSIRPPGDLEYEKDLNKNAQMSRVISVVLETRPDQLLSKNNILKLRKYGCTRIQIGVQQVKNNILKTIGRDHTIEDTQMAIKNLLNAGFKVDIHIMPDLPGTTNQDDLDMFKALIGSELLQHDQIKLYPCMDLPYTEIRKWKNRANLLLSPAHADGSIKTPDDLERDYQELIGIEGLMRLGEQIPNEAKVWRPRSETNYIDLLDTIIYFLENVNPWDRVNRIVRDFQKATEKNNRLGFETENLTLDMREVCVRKMKRISQTKCYDIRSREVDGNPPDNFMNNVRLYIRRFRASDGWEWFISAEIPVGDHPDDAVLLGLLRLRIMDDGTKNLLPEIMQKTAIVREIHVYGNLVVKRDNSGMAVQHLGIGSFLLNVAELIAESMECEKIVVISGVGVMGYYENRGYIRGKLEFGDYMVKHFIQKNMFDYIKPWFGWIDKTSYKLLNRTYTKKQIIYAGSINYNNKGASEINWANGIERVHHYDVCNHATLVIM